jgi:hypothetical protein
MKLGNNAVCETDLPFEDEYSLSATLHAPLGYVDGANTYQFVGSDPTTYVDPTGLARGYTHQEAVDYIRQSRDKIMRSIGKDKDCKAFLAAMAAIYTEMRRDGGPFKGAISSYGPGGIKPVFTDWVIKNDTQGILDPAVKGMNPGDRKQWEIDTANNDPFQIVIAAMRAIIDQWTGDDAGIQDQIDILATIYNIGPNKLSPHPGPKPGTNEVTIDGKKVNFAQFAKDFSNTDFFKEMKKWCEGCKSGATSQPATQPSGQK